MWLILAFFFQTGPIHSPIFVAFLRCFAFCRPLISFVSIEQRPKGTVRTHGTGGRMHACMVRYLLFLSFSFPFPLSASSSPRLLCCTPSPSPTPLYLRLRCCQRSKKKNKKQQGKRTACRYLVALILLSPLLLCCCLFAAKMGFSGPGILALSLFFLFLLVGFPFHEPTKKKERSLNTINSRGSYSFFFFCSQRPPQTKGVRVQQIGDKDLTFAPSLTWLENANVSKTRGGGWDEQHRLFVLCNSIGHMLLRHAFCFVGKK